MFDQIQVKALFLGEATILPNGQESAIRKKNVSQINFNKHTIAGDNIVDLKHHGGDMRVIHHYSEKNYHHLKKCFPEIQDRFHPGSFGENLYTTELSEKDLCIGDIFDVGNCKIQVTVPRRPCATINATYEYNKVLKEVISSGHVGWFYRVLKEGTIKEGDQLKHVERPFPKLKLDLLFEQGYGEERFKNIYFLKECLNTGLMDKGWKSKLEGL